MLRKALIVGINDYPEKPLKGCINDAEAVANILESNDDGSPNFAVLLKTDVASKGELKGLINERIKQRIELAKRGTALWDYNILLLQIVSGLVE